MSRRQEVGVRQLRQNLSVYLKRVKNGETLQVTERGRRVALLTPPPEGATPLGRLISAGRAAAPSGDLLKLGLPPRARGRTNLTAALRRVREDRV